MTVIFVYKNPDAVRRRSENCTLLASGFLCASGVGGVGYDARFFNADFHALGNENEECGLGRARNNAVDAANSHHLVALAESIAERLELLLTLLLRSDNEELETNAHQNEHKHHLRKATAGASINSRFCRLCSITKDKVQ